MNRLIKLAIIPIILVVVFVGWIMHSRSFQKLTISFADQNANMSVKIYRLPTADDDANPESFMKDEYLAHELDKDGSIKLKKGKYLISSVANADYAPQISTVDLNDQPQSVIINPGYTSTKLAVLLQTESPILRQLITSQFPATSQYDIGQGKLYERGDWYGTTLRPKQTEEQSRVNYIDVYRLVAHKENGQWKIVTSPPRLVISRLDYPEIPRDILIEVNKQ